MEKEKVSESTEPARAGYDAPRAQRLSDAVRASGEQCAGDGNTAGEVCTNGSGAVSCLDNGNYAYAGCRDGQSATECGQGNYAT